MGGYFVSRSAQNCIRIEYSGTKYVIFRRLYHDTGQRRQDRTDQFSKESFVGK